jgi:hypothetical protein
MDILRRLSAWLAGRLSDAVHLGHVTIGQTYHVECFDRFGKLKWAEDVHNLVVTTGLNFLLDTVYRGSAYTAANFVGLKGAGNVAAGDTMASHAGWTEVTTYDEAARPALTMAAANAGSCNNSASKAVFTISGTVTVAGAFVATNSTKGGTTGTLIGGGDFAQSRDCVDNDVLNVTVTATQAAS